MVEYFIHKFNFWQHLPYSALGIFYSEFDASHSDASRRLCAKCISESDSSFASGAGVRMHRVAEALFGEGLVRHGLDRYARGEGDSLRSFPLSFIALQLYSFAALTERRIEGLHARIHDIGRKCKHILPPAVCASLRERQTIAALREDPAFRAFCAKEFRSTTLLERVLRLRLQAGQFKGLSRVERVKMIYQCSVQDEYEDVSGKKAQYKEWEIVTAHRREAPVALVPAAWKACLQYAIAIFEDRGFYSLPKEMFDECVKYQTRELPALIAGHRNPVSMVFEAAAAGRLAVADGDVSGDVFFQVIRSNPSKRFTIPIRHLPQSDGNFMHVSLCQAAAGNDGLIRLFSDIRESHIAFYFPHLVSRLPEAMVQCRRWEVGRHQSNLVPIKKPSSHLRCTSGA